MSMAYMVGYVLAGKEGFRWNYIIVGVLMGRVDFHE